LKVPTKTLWFPRLTHITSVYRPRREAEHSPQSNATVDIVWRYTSAPLYCFTSRCLITQVVTSLLYPYIIIIIIIIRPTYTSWR
jgi:hypothetical protein